MSPQQLLSTLSGHWEGTCRTWFQPDKLADESRVVGQFTLVLGGKFLRHTYEGTIQGKPRRGEELIAFNTVTKSYETSWIDDFHMNYGILFSTGAATDGGFSVSGKYDIGENQPQWGWRTEFKLVDEDHVTITAYNVTPNGREARAVETVYVRVRK